MILSDYLSRKEFGDKNLSDETESISQLTIFKFKAAPKNLFLSQEDCRPTLLRRGVPALSKILAFY
jgi:hypothetical protein